MNTQEVFEKRNELADAMYDGDLEKVATILKTFGFVREGIVSHYDATSAYVARMTLCAAAMMETEDAITEPMAMLLIDCLAPVVDIFESLYSALGYIRFERDESCVMDIPEKLRLAFLMDEFSDEVAEAIAALSPEEFKSLAFFVLACGTVRHLSMEFARPLMACCYKRLIPGDLAFATMANNVFDRANDGPCGFTIAVIRP